MIKKSALWSILLTVPLFLLGMYLFNPHGSLSSELLKYLGLAMVYPSALVQDAGLAYKLGSTKAFIFVVAVQYIWTFLEVLLILALTRKIQRRSGKNV